MGIEDLPTLNASLNTASALCVFAGYLCIRRKNERAHKVLMLTGVLLSAGFLASYITFHLFGEAKRFPGTGFAKTAYLAMLFTHIVLAAAIVPLVLISVYMGLRNRIQRHIRIARWTLPLWLYVSVTGVVIYLVLYGFPGSGN